jgi:GNAT superfamily N-acetyltransferase
MEETAHSVEIAIGTFTPPGREDAVDVYRWQSADGESGDNDDLGEWTEDRSDAVRDGRRYARDNDQEEPEPEPEPEPDYPDEVEAEDSDSFDDMTSEEIDALFGAATLGLSVEPRGRHVGYFKIAHPKILSCGRTFHINGYGEKYIHNDIFELKDEFRGDGFGSQVFAAEVRGAIDAGFSYIVTHAARSDGRFNGYYTWLTLGYDADLASFDDYSLRRQIQKLAPGARTMQDLMKAGKLDLTQVEIAEVQTKIKRLIEHADSDKIKEMLAGKAAKTEFTGRDWWLAHGEGLEHCKFDLTAGSRSMKIFEAVMSKKKKPA